MGDQMKKVMLVISQEDRALMWYIKYSTNNPTFVLADIQTTLNGEFNRPKSQAQSIVGFKEIMMKPRETPWDSDQRLKHTIHEANMSLIDGQHCKWFVASLLPHLRVELSQQNIGTHAESLEIVMTLHETSMQDANLGVQQIHTQLQNLHLEMQSLKKDRRARLEAHEEFWCLKCKGQGHDKDHCLVFQNICCSRGTNASKAEGCDRAKCRAYTMVCYMPGSLETCDSQLPFDIEIHIDTATTLLQFLSISRS